MENQFAYYLKLLQDEVRQRSEEGCNVQDFASRFERVADIEELNRLYDQLSKLEPSSRFVEPSTLPEIQKVRSIGPRRLEITYSDNELRNRILGGWLGRCAGCQLGKPVEGWTYDQIRDHLERWSN